MDVKNLYHVSGSDNPADGLSRGLLPNQFVDYKIYFSGPSWLIEKIENWPIRAYSEFKNKEEIPEKKISSVVLVGVNNLENVVFDFFSGCSSYSKLLNVTVYILRFTKKLD
uniref:Uncharacterized protein n=1 Tax=Cacopsylla melanoneura TaxID=428564 RepID=A0A8D9ELU0_9HEMI